MVGDVRGWEWDGVVALVVTFQREGSAGWRRGSYTFGSRIGPSPERFTIPGSGIEGWAYPPFRLP